MKKKAFLRTVMIVTAMLAVMLLLPGCGGSGGSECVNHDYGEWAQTQAPSCLEKGEEKRTCKNCARYETREVAALGHDWDDGVVTRQPTEDADGLRLYTCIKCGDTREETIPNANHVHSYTDAVTAPTCTERGYTAHTCTKCGESYKDSYVEALGHNYVNGVCKECGTEQQTEGLRYALNSDKKSYSVAGIGTCTDTDIVIPSTYNDLPVTGINKTAFQGCSGLKSVAIPKTVTDIGNYAFYYCTGLTSIEIPGSVTRIGSVAFEGCAGLTNVTISDGVSNVNRCAFKDCTGLTNITIPNSVTSIGGCALEGCSNLESITLPFVGNPAKSNTFFNYIFGNVPASLKEVTITGSTSIGESAFQECSGLTSVTLGSGVTSIGEFAFYKCEGLTSITIGSGVKSIGNQAFYKCTGLTSIAIGNSVTHIGNGAFFDCARLVSITIPDSVTKIGSYAFYNTAYYNNTDNWDNGVLYIGNCLIQAKIDVSGACKIKDGTKCIADNAFYGCSSLTSITISDSVTSIGEWAFAYCTSLTKITFQGTKAQWNEIEKGTCWDNGIDEYTVHCTDGEIKKSR